MLAAAGCLEPAVVMRFPRAGLRVICYDELRARRWALRLTYALPSITSAIFLFFRRGRLATAYVLFSIYDRGSFIAPVELWGSQHVGLNA